LVQTAVNHVCCEQKANCHTYNKCKYVARKEHNEPPIFYLVGSAKPMPVCSGRWAAWEGWKRKPPLTAGPRASEGKRMGRVVHHKHTLPTKHSTTREVEDGRGYEYY
jgi:hypothetical protein